MTIDPLAERVTLRPMTLDDVEQAHAIDVMSFSLPWSARSFRFELTENTNAVLWVAELTEGSWPHRLAGFIVVWIVVDEAHIGTIAVHPDFRRQGIGQRLLVRALEDAVEKGARTALLEVRRSNMGAQELYRRFGFEVVGVRPRYYRDNGEDALLMNLNDLDADRLNQLASS